MNNLYIKKSFQIQVMTDAEEEGTEIRRKKRKSLKLRGWQRLRGRRQLEIDTKSRRPDRWRLRPTRG